LREARAPDDLPARNAAVLKGLRNALDLVHVPERIECYDVSHLAGGEVVASGVSFTDGVADKARYRHYRLRDVQRNDDFAALEEVLRRRLARGLSEGDLPDLVVIDGGRPQLRRVIEVFRELKVGTSDVIGLAKARSGDRAMGALGVFERVVLPDRDEPVVLEQASPELLLLARIRDEAHRFAIEYGRRLRRKAATASVLELVPGIGPKLARSLLKSFGDLTAVKAASEADLAAVTGMTGPKARLLRQFFAERALAGTKSEPSAPEKDPGGDAPADAHKFDDGS
jgi:excinuclease ABC subunit C